MVARKTNTQDTIQSPFGMVMPGRNWTAATANGYGFGFNRKLKDDEIMGNSDSYDFGARIYDARIGKWLSMDPKSNKYPDVTPFSFCANSPLVFVDDKGDTLRVSTKSGTFLLHNWTCIFFLKKVYDWFYYYFSFNL